VGGYRMGRRMAVMRGERKRERVGSWDRRQKPPRAAECRVPTNQLRKRSRESGAKQAVGGGQASLVRVKLKTGSGGKYKAEPAAGRGEWQRRCKPEETFTAGNLHTARGAKIVLVVTRWKLHALRSRPAVCGLGLGLPHTHGSYGMQKGFQGVSLGCRKGAANAWRNV